MLAVHGVGDLRNRLLPQGVEGAAVADVPHDLTADSELLGELNVGCTVVSGSVSGIHDHRLAGSQSSLGYLESLGLVLEGVLLHVDVSSGCERAAGGGFSRSRITNKDYEFRARRDSCSARRDSGESHREDIGGAREYGTDVVGELAVRRGPAVGRVDILGSHGVSAHGNLADGSGGDAELSQENIVETATRLAIHGILLLDGGGANEAPGSPAVCGLEHSKERLQLLLGSLGLGPVGLVAHESDDPSGLVEGVEMGNNLVGGKHPVAGIRAKAATGLAEDQGAVNIKEGDAIVGGRDGDVGSGREYKERHCRKGKL